jgi:hypothetical protein
MLEEIPTWNKAIWRRLAKRDDKPETIHGVGFQ